MTALASLPTMASLTALVLVAIAAVQPARAERGPVCRQPSVVDEFTREIRSGNYYSSIDPRLVTEQPTTDPGLVRCQVCVQSAPYDTMRYGDQPIRRCLPHDFEVRILPTGFVVRDLR